MEREGDYNSVGKNMIILAAVCFQVENETIRNYTNITDTK